MQNKKQERWFFTKFFCEKNEPSSKRLVGIVGSFCLFASLILGGFSETFKIPSDALVDAIALLSFGSLGITGAERIFSKKQDKQDEQEKVD
jgi:hypothetical protein